MTPNAAAYDRHFYAGQQPRSYESATVILPLLFTVWRPNSVVDVGCGVGTWLKAAQALGVTDLRGVDGPWVPRDAFAHTPIHFVPTDLEAQVRLDRRFDLALSLEVAEHLAADRADGFIEDLCALADVILFSAAVPLQGGTEHVNEQFQSYWATRFRNRGYTAIDLVRPAVWNDDRVEWWYRQNTLLYVKQSRLPTLPAISSTAGPHPALLDVVHPALVEKLRWQLERPSTRFAASLAARAVKHFIAPSNSVQRQTE